MKPKDTRDNTAKPELHDSNPGSFESNEHEELPLKKTTLLSKCRKAFTMVGEKGLNQAFILYYTLIAKETPLWCRSVILGALGYFISIIDGIPDLTPVLGYTDDITVMAAAIATLATYVTPEIKSKAEAQTKKLLAKSSSYAD